MEQVPDDEEMSLMERVARRAAKAEADATEDAAEDDATEVVDLLGRTGVRLAF